MFGPLSGQHILLTGGSSGIGAETARHLTAAGATVTIIARRAPEMAQLVEKARNQGGRLQALRGDVTNLKDVQAAVSLAARDGKLDGLILNAGILPPVGHIADVDPEAWAENVKINLVGSFLPLQAALPFLLRAPCPRVVAISSGAATNAYEGWSAYCAAKAGLAQMINVARVEAPQIKFFTFRPGTVETQMQVEVRKGGFNEVAQMKPEDHPPASEAARSIEYLMTDAADDLAGQHFSIRDLSFRQRVGLS